MNKRRLLKMAGLLEADAKNKKGVRFDTGTFGNILNKDKPLSCRTTACAFGLAAISGAFKRAGLDYRTDYDAWSGGNSLSFKWRGRKTQPYHAASRLFNITTNQARYLFDGSLTRKRGGVGERIMAKAIRDFVAGKAGST